MSSPDLHATCPVCGSHDIITLRPYRYQHAIFKNGKIVQCRACDMVFAFPVPGETELRRYNEGYFDNAHGGVATHPLTVAFYSAISFIRMQYVRAFQQKHGLTVQNILEIGPGTGYFAKHWLERNPGTGYTGVESDASCYDQLKQFGVKEIYATLGALPADKRFDLVVISHVLEHTTDPSAFITACTQQLSPGGMLFIEVPCNDYQHKPIDEPHLLFFDKGPMHLLLERTKFGSIQLSYHGETVRDLKKPVSSVGKFTKRVRNFLLGRGIITPFATSEKGLESMTHPLERAVIKPFSAHVEQSEPGWWLRAIAIKNQNDI